MKISPKMKQFAWKVLSDEDFSDFEKEVKSLIDLDEKNLCFLNKLTDFFYKKMRTTRRV